ncbi:MAG: chemotaxis protein CheW, partial [Dehalococcoidales bacterium]|nr:chemotaxis protein CheW [Dehalococcoidales bacterium]
VELTGRDINNTHGRHVMNVRDRLVPYVRLSEFFVTSDREALSSDREALSSDREALSIEQVIVVQAEDFTTGLVVDRIVGEKQAVIKPLGKMFRQADGVSGATILGDGTVALILDVPQITRCAQREEAA